MLCAKQLRSIMPCIATLEARTISHQRPKRSSNVSWPRFFNRIDVSGGAEFTVRQTTPPNCRKSLEAQDFLLLVHQISNPTKKYVLLSQSLRASTGIGCSEEYEPCFTIYFPTFAVLQGRSSTDHALKNSAIFLSVESRTAPSLTHDF